MPPLSSGPDAALEDYPALKDVVKLSNEHLPTVATFLLRVCDNIISDPGHSDPKLRRLRLSSGSLAQCLAVCASTLDLLFQLGFQEDPASDEHLLWPLSASTAPLSRCRGVLAQEQARRAPGAACASTPSLTAQRDDAGPALATPPSRRPEMREECLRMLRTITGHLPQVQRYHTAHFQAKVKQAVPVARLLEDAARLLLTDAHRPGAPQTAFLYSLLRWFKSDFFTWVNQPPCDHCAAPSTVPLPPDHTSLPSPAEARLGASRVELYRCVECQRVTRFARYNDPGKLLETRRGRCGEWANCFTGVCVALGLEARLVLDDADHVWTEVWSVEEGRWMHCDACETAMDQPLLYESGWGKKLGYVLAFAREEVTDVSWRYSADHPSMRRRRTAVPEAWLRETISLLNRQLQRSVSAERKTLLWKRRWGELTELLLPRSARDTEKMGRSSGSLAWRLGRGEVGEPGSAREAVVIRPSAEEVAGKSLRVAYNCAADRYTRGAQTLRGFASLVHNQENMLRKEETDWHKAYLARLPGSSVGRIAWRVDCADSGVSIASVHVTAPRTVFHSGQASLTISTNGSQQAQLTGPEETYSGTFPPASVTQLDIGVVLSGGDGDTAWQHAQLCRQDSTDPNEALVILVHFHCAS